MEENRKQSKSENQNISIMTRPNSVELKGRNRRFNIVKPLKNKDSNELSENRNVIQIKALVSETDNLIISSKISDNGKIKETIIGFIDHGLYELYIALDRYHKQIYSNK